MTDSVINSATQEATDYANFLTFIAKADPNHKIFNEYTPTKLNSFFDANGKNHTGGTYIIEFKGRGENAGKYKDCFIEFSKLMNLREAWKYADLYPYYINFIGDWREVYMFFPSELTNEDTKMYFNVPLSNGKTEDRIGIKWSAGLHFKWNDEKGKYDVSGRKPQVAPAIALQYDNGKDLKLEINKKKYRDIN